MLLEHTFPFCSHRPNPCCLQHGAQLALVELQPRDAAEWRRRVEARGAVDAGTENSHKPGSWADIQAIAARNAGSEAWSEALGEGEPLLRLTLDSTAPGADTAAQLTEVLAMLRRSRMPRLVKSNDYRSGSMTAELKMQVVGQDGLGVALLR